MVNGGKIQLIKLAHANYPAIL